LPDQEVDDEPYRVRDEDHQNGPELGIHSAAFRVLIDVTHEQCAADQNGPRKDGYQYSQGQGRGVGVARKRDQEKKRLQTHEKKGSQCNRPSWHKLDFLTDNEFLFGCVIHFISLLAARGGRLGHCLHATPVQLTVPKARGRPSSRPRVHVSMP
jgi:hypothetical protein